MSITPLPRSSVFEENSLSPGWIVLGLCSVDSVLRFLDSFVADGFQDFSLFLSPDDDELPSTGSSCEVYVSLI